MIYLSSTHIEIVKQEAIASYPIECCGLLLGKVIDGKKRVNQVIATENDWENQEYLFTEFNLENQRQCQDSFSINPLTFLKIQKQARAENLDIIGIYHSHPDHPAIPSDFDTQFAWSQYSYVILSVNQHQVNNFRSWTLNELRQFREENIQVSLGDFWK